MPNIESSIPKYYCARKFTDSSIDLVTGTSYACCHSTSKKLTLAEIQENKIGFFNNQYFKDERQRMLNGEKISECFHCWHLEDQGLDSPRTRDPKNKILFENNILSPRTLTISLANTCKLSCVYCGKHASSTWLADIVKNGDYNLDTDQLRFKQQPADKLFLALSADNKKNSKFKNIILTQIADSKPISINIIGGEPLLDKSLVNIINQLSCNNITIFTGLGLNKNYLENILSEIPDNVNFVVSAESTDQLFELNRFGVSYKNFLENFEILNSHTKNISLHSVISNTSVLGYSKFLDYFRSYNTTAEILTIPEFLSLYVLDEKSKNKVKTDLEKYSDRKIIQDIFYSIDKVPSELEKSNFKNFIEQFCNRRHVTPGDYLPESLITWLFSE